MTSGTLDPRTDTTKPTVVLVHGAFADSSSWNGVIAQLRHDGYPVIGVAFAVLSRLSQHSNVKLREVARTLVETGELPRI